MQRRRRRVTWREESTEEEDVTAELKCPVCLEFLTRPTILPCCHILCRDPCAERLFRSGFVRCPVCRDDSYVSGGINTLPRVITLERIIERYSNRTVSSSSSSSSSHYEVEIAVLGDVVCQLCSYLVKDSNDEATETLISAPDQNTSRTNEEDEEEDEDIGPAVKAFKFCKQCSVAYCKPCLKTSHPDHPPFDSHQLVDPKLKLVSASPSQLPRLCMRHNNNEEKEEEDEEEDDEVYCIFCKKFFCRRCALEMQKDNVENNNNNNNNINKKDNNNNNINNSNSETDSNDKESDSSNKNINNNNNNNNSNINSTNNENDNHNSSSIDNYNDNQERNNKSHKEANVSEDETKDEECIGNDGKHQFVSFVEASRLFMTKLKTKLNSLESCFDSSSQQQRQLKSCLTSLQNNMADRKSKILKECDSLLHEVETKRQFFLSDLQFEERGKVSTINDIVERNKSRNADLDKQVNRVRKLLECSEHKVFIIEATKFLESNIQPFQTTEEDSTLNSLLTSLLTPVTTKVIDLRKERAVLRDVNYLTLPSTPSIDLASCYRSSTSVMLSLKKASWEDVVVDGYVVYYNNCNNSKPHTWTKLSFTTPNETRLMGRSAIKEGAICLIHESLESGSMYYFAVSAFNACGSSDISEVVQCSTLQKSQRLSNAPSILFDRCRTFTYSAQLRTSIPLDDPQINKNTYEDQRYEVSTEQLPAFDNTNIYSTFKSPSSRSHQNIPATVEKHAEISSGSVSNSSDGSVASTGEGSVADTGSAVVNSSTFVAGSSTNDQVSMGGDTSYKVVESDGVDNIGATYPHISTKPPTTLISTITPSLSCPAMMMSCTTSINPSILTSTHVETSSQSVKSQSSQINNKNQSHHSIAHYLLYRESSGKNKIWKSITLYGKFDHRVFGLEPNTHYDMVIMSCDVVTRCCHVSNMVTLTTERSAY